MPKDFSAAQRRLVRSADELRDPAAAEHVRSVQEQIDAISRGEYAAALRAAHPDVELEIFAPRDFPFVRRARGVAEIERALARNFGALEDQKPEISSVVAQGDVVVLIGRERGRIRATNAPYEVEFVHRFTFRDGALASVRIVAATVA
jgi:uncharacterized protein